jgi:hypothetical protein
MATNVTVWAAQAAVAVDVSAGSTQFWQTTGTPAQWGRYVTYVAQPLQFVGMTGTNEFEVHDVSHEVNDVTGARRVRFQVTSKGTAAFGSYAIYIVFTDVIPS